MRLSLKNEYMDICEPAVMGILNLTPDSFSDGGRYLRFDPAMRHAERMIAEGASIIDIGGESTRPGAGKVDIDTEIDRVLPVIEKIKTEFGILVSIDTYKDRVAELALAEAGADMVNDISALSFSGNMAEVVLKYNVPVVLMHIRGTPEDMQKDPFYLDVIGEITEYFNERVDYAVSRGIKREKIIIDPGIGFGKRTEDNTTIIKNIDRFRKLDLPVMIGLSRKSFLGVLSGRPVPSERDIETVTAGIIAAMNGASILRVHDVGLCVRSMKILRELI